jgi:hypothetical protein
MQVKVPALQQLAQRYGQDNDAYWIILKNIEQHNQMMQMKAGKAPAAMDAMRKAEQEMMGGGGNPQMPQEGPMPAPAPAAAAPLPLPG